MSEFQDSPSRGDKVSEGTANNATAPGLSREHMGKQPESRHQSSASSILPTLELSKSTRIEPLKNSNNGSEVNSKETSLPMRQSSRLDKTRALIDKVPAAEAMVGAVTTRIAVLGLTDRLHVDQFTVGKELAKLKSPVAKQLTETLETMQQEGWQVWKQAKALPDRGQYDAASKKIWYAPKGSMAAYMIGIGPSPIKQTVVPLAENLAYHHKNLLTYCPWWVDPRTTSGDGRIMATREFINGIKPRLVDVHISEQLNISDSLTADRRTALQRGSIGSQILAEMPETKKALGASKQFANLLANEYTDWKFGPVVDRMSGKVSPFNIKAGLNAVPAELAQDANMQEYLAKPGTVEQLRKNAMFERRTSLASLSGFTETKAGSAMTRGGKTLGAIGLFALANDVGGAFHESTGSGFGRIGKSVIDWLGFEAGVKMGGRLLAESFPKMSSRGRMLGTLGIGLLSAHLVSEPAKEGEKRIKELIDTELAREKSRRPLSITDFNH